MSVIESQICFDWFWTGNQGRDQLIFGRGLQRLFRSSLTPRKLYFLILSRAIDTHHGPVSNSDGDTSENDKEKVTSPGEPAGLDKGNDSQ